MPVVFCGLFYSVPETKKVLRIHFFSVFSEPFSCYFSRYFKQHTGERYIDFLSRLRIDEAVRLLANPENRISDIYPAVGYHSRRHFSKLFYDTTGYTPSDYRKYVLKMKT